MTKNPQQKNSFLYISGLPDGTKENWKRAAQKSGKPLVRWAEDVLDEAASNVLVKKTVAEPSETR